jgi:DNA polymerase-3 subunit epsilon
MKSIVDLLGLKKKKKMSLDETMPISDAHYAVIDTELTGLDEKRDSIVSLGGIKMVGGRINLGDTFYQLVNPETKLTAESVCIHEITPSDVTEKPDIETVLTEFLTFCSTDILVGHYLSIDLSFINREMKRLFGAALKNAVLDTLVLYDFVRKQVPSHGSFVSPPREYTQLYDIAKTLDVPVSGAHNAIMDAFITAQVFQRLIPMLMTAGIRSIGNLMKLSARGGDTFRTSWQIVNL